MKKALKAVKHAKKAPHHNKEAAAEVRKRAGRELLFGIFSGLLAIGFIGAFVIVQVIRDRQPKLELTIKSWNTSSGSEAFHPKKDHEFVVVTVAMQHHLEKPAWFAPVLQSYVINQNGERYGMSPLESEKPFVAGEYKPGSIAEGVLTYQIPKNSENLRLCYRFDAASPRPVCRALPAK